MFTVKSTLFQLAPRIPFGLNAAMKFGSKHLGSFCGAPLLTASLMFPLWFAACGGGGSSDAGSPANAVIKNENNYTSTSYLTIPQVATASGADLHACWTTLGTDLLGHPVVPTVNVDHVSFLQIVNVTEAQVAVQFAAGQFDTKKVKVYRDLIIDHTTGSTCTNLSAMSLGATSLVPAQDYVTDSTKTYMLLFASGTTPGSGSKSMLFLEPSASSTNVEVTAPEGKDILHFTADLTTPLPVSIPAAGPFVIDWSKLTRDGMGNTVVYQNIDGLLVGYYEGMTVADLQARCLDFDIIATSLYRADVPTGVRSMDLATTKTDAGEVFPGFTRRSGVWAVGLMCSTCQVPAPVAVAILNPT